MDDKIIEFIYNSSWQKPKKLQNNLFVLHSPKRIKIRPEELINADMKLPVCLPEQLLPTLCKNGLSIESFQYILTDNICNANQPTNLPSTIHFELVNRNTNTVFSICKRQVLDFLAT